MGQTYTIVTSRCCGESLLSKVGHNSVMGLFKDNAHNIPSSIHRASRGLNVTVRTPGGDTGSSQAVDIDLSDRDLTQTQKTELLS